jgi:hypothetical protein
VGLETIIATTHISDVEVPQIGPWRRQTGPVQ